MSSEERPYLGLHLKCCNVYLRVYINATGDAYAGNCPKCAKPVRVNIAAEGEGGSSNTFFEAS